MTKLKTERDEVVGFPKREAVALAVASEYVLRARGEELGLAMLMLSKALRTYDDAIMALVDLKPRKAPKNG